MGTIFSIDTARAKREQRESPFVFRVLRDTYNRKRRITLQITERDKASASSKQRVSPYMSYQYVYGLPNHVRIVTGVTIRDIQECLPIAEDPSMILTLGTLIQTAHIRDVANMETSAVQQANENERYQPLLAWVVSHETAVIPKEVIHRIYVALEDVACD